MTIRLLFGGFFFQVFDELTVHYMNMTGDAFQPEKPGHDQAVDSTVVTDKGAVPGHIHIQFVGK